MPYIVVIIHPHVEKDMFSNIYIYIYMCMNKKPAIQGQARCVFIFQNGTKNPSDLGRECGITLALPIYLNFPSC